jgi:hypothetical protein
VDTKTSTSAAAAAAAAAAEGNDFVAEHFAALRADEGVSWWGCTRRRMQLTHSLKAPGLDLSF